MNYDTGMIWVGTWDWVKHGLERRYNMSWMTDWHWHKVEMGFGTI